MDLPPGMVEPGVVHIPSHLRRGLEVWQLVRLDELQLGQRKEQRDYYILRGTYRSLLVQIAQDSRCCC